MTTKIGRIIMMFLGAVLGFVVADSLHPFLQLQTRPIIFQVAFYILGVVIFAIIFYLLSNFVFLFFRTATTKAYEALQEFSLTDIITGTIGLAVGLILATLVSIPLQRIELPYVGNVIMSILSIGIYISLGILGIRVALRDKEEWSLTFSKLKSNPKEKSLRKGKSPIKILDTSVIIDGRIYDIMDAGFIEGQVLIPIFVLEELQHIADSENNIRRQKGRRGLDVLNQLQERFKDRVEITMERYDEIEEVDSKLLKMAKELNGVLLTNDYNLNKVASVQKIPVLNINELANAMKPVVIPGEEMLVHVIKEGNQSDQGLGYLDDGTMIVVEDGIHYIGQQVNTIVTSVIQTAAGKMIFVKLNENL